MTKVRKLPQSFFGGFLAIFERFCIFFFYKFQQSLIHFNKFNDSIQNFDLSNDQFEILIQNTIHFDLFLS